MGIVRSHTARSGLDLPVEYLDQACCILSKALQPNRLPVVSATYQHAVRRGGKRVGGRRVADAKSCRRIGEQ
ncbi:hypothetical protein [Tumebacillus algifaecis]|uniref:hypothetical protein n=1 Tax=Tumebacillus algifaecis TaxID=1214604 RepID=UPI0012FDA7EC|nr:hypothetical protein [Tumebacillus algifaecis]